MTDLATAILQVSGIRPTNAAASARPSDRTVRYYIARGLIAPPEGRGTAATYSYRHLLQILAIKLRQMEGSTLDAIGEELSGQTGDVIERRVAAALGGAIPPLSRLALGDPAKARGRAGKAIHTWNALAPEEEEGDAEKRLATTKWHRIRIARGLEVHIHEGHPLARQIDRSDEIADAVRVAANRVLIEPD